MGADLSVAAVDFAAPFCVGRTLPSGVTFVDDGLVENVFPEWQAEMGWWIASEANWFKGRKVVQSALGRLEEGILRWLVVVSQFWGA